MTNRLLPRVYPILDTALLTKTGISALAVARCLLESGARILQFRHKDNYTRGIYDEARAVAELCRTQGAEFVVNDRADIARLLDAGLHLGQDDLPLPEARTIVGSQALVGFSTHNEAQLRAAANNTASYLALGPVFGTSSKANPDPVVGVEEFGRLRPLSPVPLVAIGGITLERAPEVWGAGADSIAVIGALFQAPCTLDSIRARFQEWQSASMLS